MGFFTDIINDARRPSTASGIQGPGGQQGSGLEPANRKPEISITDAVQGAEVQDSGVPGSELQPLHQKPGNVSLNEVQGIEVQGSELKPVNLEPGTRNPDEVKVLEVQDSEAQGSGLQPLNREPENVKPVEVRSSEVQRAMVKNFEPVTRNPQPEPHNSQPVLTTATIQGPGLKPLNREPGTRERDEVQRFRVENSEPATRNAQPAIQNPQLVTRDSQSTTRNPPPARTTDTIKSLRDTEQQSSAPAVDRGSAASREAPGAGGGARQVASAPFQAATTIEPATAIPPGPRLQDGRQATAADSGPRVHIGRIDIVVLSPEPARRAQTPVSAPHDLANRLYLRRL